MKEDSYFDKISNLYNLELAWNEIKLKDGAIGVDNVSVEEFDNNITENLKLLSNQLKNGEYTPKPLFEFKKYKKDNKYRKIVITSVSDRVVQKSFVNILEPLFELHFYQFSYAYRKSRGQRDIVNLIQTLFKQKKFRYVSTGDIRNYFDNIDQETLIKFFKEKICNEDKIVEILKMWLQNYSIDVEREFMKKENGLYEGYIISPILSNLYLTLFDSHWENNNYLYLRYADNYIFLTQDIETAEKLYRESENYLSNNYNLRLNDQDYQLSSIDEGFTFLGILFKGSTLTISDKKLLKIKKKIRSIVDFNGSNIEDIIDKLNKSVNSWKYYYSLINQKKVKKEINNYIINYIVKKIVFLRISKDEMLNIINRVVLFDNFDSKKIVDMAINNYNYEKNRKTDTKAIIKENRKVYKKEVNLNGEWVILKQGTSMTLSYNKIIMKNGSYKSEVSLNKISAIQIGDKNNSITTNLIKELSVKKIPVYITDSFSRPIASIIPSNYSSLGKSRKQIEAFYNKRASYLAKEFIIGKIKNQQKLLTYYAKYWRKKSHRFSYLFNKFKESSNKTIEKIKKLDGSNIRDLQLKIMGEEGIIASKYWEIFAFLILPENFKRDKNGYDITNIMLNYGYGILYNRIHTELIKEGLNPQISYLHSEQKNKPTLVYDLIEQFRAPVVERSVIKIINKKQKIELKPNSKLLSDKSRKILAKVFLNRLHSYFNYRETETSFAEQIKERVKLLNRFLNAEKVKGNLYSSFIMRS